MSVLIDVFGVLGIWYVACIAVMYACGACYSYIVLRRVGAPVRGLPEFAALLLPVALVATVRTLAFPILNAYRSPRDILGD